MSSLAQDLHDLKFKGHPPLMMLDSIGSTYDEQGQLLSTYRSYEPIPGAIDIVEQAWIEYRVRQEANELAAALRTPPSTSKQARL